jgi:hypothetical protein
MLLIALDHHVKSTTKKTAKTFGIPNAPLPYRFPNPKWAT